MAPVTKSIGVSSVNRPPGAQPSGSVNGPPTGRPSVTGRLMVVFHAGLPDDAVAKLPPDFVEKAAEAGWRRVDGGFEKRIVGANGTISAGAATVSTDGNGYFTFPDTASKSEVRLDLSVGSAQITRTRTRDARGVAEWNINADVLSCCSQGSEVRHASEPDRPEEGCHCLDYNGWFSDGKIYPYNDWRKYRNFVMSDCDRSPWYLACPIVDKIAGSCMKAHAGQICSVALGHSTQYHKHNYPN
jgi:hypothetical protein